MSDWKHYVRQWRQAVRAERERLKVRLSPAEPDFLPAALEVIERPVSPTARLTSWLLLTGLVLTLLWAAVGQVDIVASAEGAITPTDNVKLVQASGPGVVRHIHVREGDWVRRGAPLIDLDPTVSGAEEIQAAAALAAARIEAARSLAVADALSGRSASFEPAADLPAEVAHTQRRLVEAQLAQSRSGQASLLDARAAALADARSAQAQIDKYNATLPILDKQIAGMNALAAKGYAPGMRLMELNRQRGAEAGEREVARAQRERALADARKFAAQANEAAQDARQRALSDLARAQSEVVLRGEELRKAREKSRLQRLVAPVDGSIQQLDVHTVGGVVEAAKPLMIVVPDGALTVQARVLNKDAGFVRAGQPVAVKLQAFPFTVYGTVPGRIVSISRDAVPDKDVGPYFLARIALERDRIDTPKGPVKLTAGLAATSDIVVGRRSILAYLVGPIEQIRREAGRER
ncbi:HlyD family type I secretion periplasmic adaptor subunit [Caulobacter segnis]|uniref:Membrane fusion protein (MFP) family protein n=2 Tax=Caulobacter segnis TaxID=88688 RepID=D5VLZ8_CAUST|nr:HlyD family type I secretion periplasmic adaptor subunit [Caulobacter segnis]ADG11521.1 type I secretion membrane fusion protein, HlyD family [Caulobacter segnis ATCC 21756]AVQ03179.1 HlyD family type I secretion periplasmic adaptor subunit [Caulobacter segnis]